MRIFNAKVDTFAQGSCDMVERYLKATNFPEALSVSKNSDTSAIEIELSNGAMIEVESGATHYLTGIALDNLRNARLWLAMVKADSISFYREEIALLTAAIAHESGAALQEMQEEIARFERKIALAA